MEFKVTPYATTIVAVLLAIPGPLAADQDLSKVERKTGAMDARTLLKKGQASGALPEGMVVRIAACLGAAPAKAPGDRVPKELKETWEFTSNQVHRVVIESKEGELSYHRVESRPFDSKGICKDLLEGKAIKIQARKGEGPEVAFVGTSYHLGSRFIEVVWNGETILDLHESRAADLELYRESDARAFAALYERLASQARVVFKMKKHRPISAVIVRTGEYSREGIGQTTAINILDKKTMEKLEAFFPDFHKFPSSKAIPVAWEEGYCVYFNFGSGRTIRVTVSENGGGDTWTMGDGDLATNGKFSEFVKGLERRAAR